jgi:hypothetical protein
MTACTWQAVEKVDDTRVFRCNPTNAVGGSFILCLHGDTWGGPESHQRSWWIVHIRPGSDHPESESERESQAGYERSTNCVGGIQEHASPLLVGHV